MSKLPVTADDLNPESWLLPIEEEKEVNGIKKMVPIQYFGQITMAKTKTSERSGNDYLEVTVSIDVPGKDRISITDIFSFSKKALWKLSDLVRALNLDANNLDTEDFFGLWIVLTLSYREYEIGEADPITGEKRKQKDNIIKNYLRLATVEEVSKLGGSSDGEEPGF